MAINVSIAKNGFEHLSVKCKVCHLLLEQDAADADEDEEGSTYIVDLLIMGLDESALTESDVNAFGEIFMNDYNEIDDGYMTITSASVEVVGQAPKRRGKTRNLRLRGRYSRMRMRARASGKNVGARRPLFRSNVNRREVRDRMMTEQRDLSADDSVFQLLENYSSDLLERYPDIKFMEVLPELPE